LKLDSELDDDKGGRTFQKKTQHELEGKSARKEMVTIRNDYINNNGGHANDRN